MLLKKRINKPNHYLTNKLHKLNQYNLTRFETGDAERPFSTALAEMIAFGSVEKFYYSVSKMNVDDMLHYTVNVDLKSMVTFLADFDFLVSIDQADGIFEVDVIRQFSPPHALLAPVIELILLESTRHNTQIIAGKWDLTGYSIEGLEDLFRSYGFTVEMKNGILSFSTFYITEQIDQPESKTLAQRNAAVYLANVNAIEGVNRAEYGSPWCLLFFKLGDDYFHVMEQNGLKAAKLILKKGQTSNCSISFFTEGQDTIVIENLEIAQDGPDTLFPRLLDLLLIRAFDNEIVCIKANIYIEDGPLAKYFVKMFRRRGYTADYDEEKTLELLLIL